MRKSFMVKMLHSWFHDNELSFFPFGETGHDHFENGYHVAGNPVILKPSIEFDEV
jgi:hypothetical protein